MCFSAEVSFGASAVLAVTGIVAMKKATVPSQLFFAAIPFIFGIQQLSEGILWLTFSKSELVYLRSFATHAFIVFAEAVWPLWVPLSIWMLEKDPKRKKALFAFLMLGTAFSIYVIICLASFPVEAQVIGHHLKYFIDFRFIPAFGVSVWYFIPTVASCLVSSVKKMPLLGIVVAISYIIARIFFEYYALSVWCFFAAILSIQIIYIINGLNNEIAGKSRKIPMAFPGRN